MTKKQEQLVFLLMGLNVLVFLASFMAVSINQRLAADDFHYLLKVNEIGIGVYSLLLQPLEHEMGIFHFSSIVPKTFGLNSVILVANCFSIMFGLLSVQSLIKGLMSVTKIEVSRVKQWLISGYILMVIFLITFDKADTWFWLSSTPSYLWGCFAAILGGSLLLKPRNSVVRFVYIAVVFLYVGGSSESVALSTIIALCYLGFITKKETQTITINRKALHLATIVCLVSFGITLIGPGLDVRKEYLPQYPISDKFLVGLWNYVRFNFKEIPLVLPLVILAVAPFGILGRKQLRFQLITIREIFWANKKLWGLADLTIAIIALSLALVMGEMGPTRTWLPITFIVVAVAVFVAYQLGTWVYIKSNGKLIHLVVGAQILLFSFQGWSGYTQVRTTNQYAVAVDERMKTIASHESIWGDVLVLNKLPESGWIFSSEITSDTAHFSNNHLELFFANKHNLAIKEPVSSSLK